MVYNLKNAPEDMELWMANRLYGLHFKIENRYYGGVKMFWLPWPWRRKVYDAGLKTIANPWVKRHQSDF